MYKRPSKKVSVTLTPYIYNEWGRETIRYIEKGNESPDPNNLLYWGWGVNETGYVDLLPGDYKGRFTKAGKPVTFTVVIPGERCATAMQERAYVGGAIRQKVAELIDDGYVLMLRKTKTAAPKTKKPRKTASKSRMTLSDIRKDIIEARGVDETVLGAIANIVGLKPSDKQRFVKFGMLWWGGSEYRDVYYMSEWAERFDNRREYAMADFDRLELLRQVDGVEEARKRLRDAYIVYGSSQDKADKKVDEIYPKQRRSKPRKSKRKVKK